MESLASRQRYNRQIVKAVYPFGCCNPDCALMILKQGRNSITRQTIGTIEVICLAVEDPVYSLIFGSYPQGTVPVHE